MERQNAAIAYQTAAPYIVPVRRPAIDKGLFETFISDNDLIETTEKSYRSSLSNFENWVDYNEFIDRMSVVFL